MSVKRLDILDFWRGVAIFCVVIDHLFAWLWIPEWLEAKKGWFIFSVAPLFFLAGVTYCLSFLAKPPSFLSEKSLFKFILAYLKYFWRKANKLIYAYLLALLLTNFLFAENRLWSLTDYLLTAMQFPSQFYFISIYLQLLLLAPFFCWLCQWLAQKFSPRPLKAFFSASGMILIIAVILNQWPVFSERLWYPAQLLGGGIELWVFASGIFLAFAYYHDWWQSIVLPWWLWGLISGLCIYGLYLFGAEPYLFRHPPGFFTIIYSILLLIFLAALHHYLRFIPLITKIVAFFGQQSLAIFLYHGFFMEKLIKHYPDWNQYPLLWQFILLSIITVLLSCIMGYLTAWLMAAAGKLYRLAFFHCQQMFAKKTDYRAN